MSRGRQRKTDLAPLEAWARSTLAEIEGTNDLEKRVAILMRVAKSVPRPICEITAAVFERASENQ